MSVIRLEMMMIILEIPAMNINPCQKYARKVIVIVQYTQVLPAMIP